MGQIIGPFNIWVWHSLCFLYGLECSPFISLLQLPIWRPRQFLCCGGWEEEKEVEEAKHERSAERSVAIRVRRDDDRCGESELERQIRYSIFDLSYNCRLRLWFCADKKRKKRRMKSLMINHVL